MAGLAQDEKAGDLAGGRRIAIRLAGDPLLTERMAALDFTTALRSEIAAIDDILRRAMVNTAAMGVAAPQIGIRCRAFAMHMDGLPFVLFNPVIVESMGSVVGPEGCLSYPGLFPFVRRARTIMVRWWNAAVQPQAASLHDLEARCFQHELDHLDGILLDRRASAQAMASARALKR